MSTELLLFSTKQEENRFHPNTFLHGFLYDKDGIIHAHSRFNYSETSRPFDSNTLFINTLSTFRAYVWGKVEQILGTQECDFYKNQDKNLAKIINTTPIMIENIIGISPEHVDYIVIPCAHQNLDSLRNHYFQIGEKLQEKWLITKIGNFHSDSVFYKLS